MSVPTNITDLSATASLNSPSGSDSMKGVVDDFLRMYGAFIRQGYDRSQAIEATMAALAASSIANTPAGNIAAATVQAAINELDSEKQPIDADLTAIAALSGTTGYYHKTGAGTAELVTDPVSAPIHSATEKTTPADADEFGIIDSDASNALKRMTWANIVAALKTALSSVFGIQRGTAVATTSGTFIDFTGIPSTARRVTVVFDVFGTSGASIPQIQLGNGSPVTTGYTGGVMQSNGVYLSSTVGHKVSPDWTSSTTIIGSVVFENYYSNVWHGKGNLDRSDNYVETSNSRVSLSSSLDMVRITMANGTDTCRTGYVNVFWER